MTAYFQRLDGTRFSAEATVQGAWNTDQQHIAPSLGLLTHVVEQDRDRRRGPDLELSRLSFDILGTLPVGVVEVGLRVLRPGRTIELVEATLRSEDRAALVLRAWMLKPSDTTAVEGTHFASLSAPEQHESWSASQMWPGEFVRTVEARRTQLAPGRAQVWLRPLVPLVEREAVSLVARALGVLDLANGVTPRVGADEVAFPNLDTTVHLFREPRGEWVGLDVTVTFGPGGIGLTHSVLHDVTGPVGTVAQILTVRPRN
jgi:hypothetical protein